MSPEVIQALYANAAPPPRSRTKMKNGQLVLNEPDEPTRGRGGLLSSLISEAGGTGGAVGGAALGTAILPGVGTLAGALIGGFGGGFLGRLAENKVRDDRLGVGDALKEGAWSGVMGAGPLRLAKTGGSALKAAVTGADDVLAAAGKTALAPGVISRTLNRGLDRSAESFATKSLKLNNANFNDAFFKRTGEEVGAAARRFRLPQMGAAKTVDTVYRPAAKVYTEAVESIGNISKKDILSAVKKETADLAKNSIPEQRALATEVSKRAGELVKQYGDSIPALEVQKIKGELFDMVDKAITDKAGRYSNNIYDRLGKSFKTAINDAADKAGVTVGNKELAKLGFKSSRLGDLGEELFSLSDLLEYAGKKSRVGAGTGYGSLRTLLAAGAAGPMGVGPALATAGTIQLANSAAGRKGIASTLDKLAKRGAAKAAKGPFTIGKVAPRVAAGSMLNNAINGQSSFGMSNDMSINPNANSMPSNMPQEYALQDNMTMDQLPQYVDNSPFSPANVEANVQAIIANGGTLSDVKEYVSLVEALQSITGKSTSAGGKPMSSEAAKTQSNALAGIEAINDFESQVASDPGAFQRTIIPGRNMLGGYIGGALGTTGIDAATQQIVDVIARLRTGAAISQAEEARFKQFIPRPGDPENVRQQKLGYLRRQFERVANEVAQGGAGTDLESALLGSAL